MGRIPSNTSSRRELCRSLRGAIAAGELGRGARLESLRAASRRLGVSAYTVLRAYEELRGLGLVEARHGSGYYVCAAGAPALPAIRAPARLDRLLDTALLIRGIVEPGALLKVGSGALPAGWLSGLHLHRHVRSVAAQPAANLYGYGPALGYPPLREAVRRRLARRGVECPADRVLLTAGATQGLELVARALCRPGDTVLVESPGYYNLFGLLQLAGLRVRAVPRRVDGPDLAAVRAMLHDGERPRVLVVQPLLHNPTGTSLSRSAAERLLALAEEHDFVVAENDVYADLAADDDVRLAALDGLRRVLYVSGFTKTVSAGLRVGFVAASAPMIEALTRVKLLTSIATPEFVERVIYRVLAEGGYDRFVASLRRRLARARERWCDELARGGWHAFPSSRHGMFVWARHPAWPDSLALARGAIAAGLWLAPGSAFDPEHAPSPWVRFNVAYRSPALSRWLARPR